MRISFGRKADGSGVVRPGVRPWSVALERHPSIMHIDLITGDAVCVGLSRAWRLGKMRHAQRLRRESDAARMEALCG